MNAYAISGEIVERQFYIIVWDSIDDDVQRELLNRSQAAFAGFYSTVAWNVVCFPKEKSCVFVTL